MRLERAINIGGVRRVECERLLGDSTSAEGWARASFLSKVALIVILSEQEWPGTD
jgi:hypothetical protein